MFSVAHCVQRGHLIKPDANVIKAYQELAEAQAALERASAALNKGKGSNPLLLPRTDIDLERVSDEQLKEAFAVLVEENKKLLAIINDQETVSQMILQYRTTLLQFASGGAAGITARTVVAPIDRVKILMQTQRVSGGSGADKYTGLLSSLRTIIAEEGVSGLWRSNFANVIRVAPYSATQFASYDLYKTSLGIGQSATGEKRSFVEQLVQRLLCGGLAGLTATTVTHPLDVIRLRVATDKEVKGITDACLSLIKEGGPLNLYRGYIPTVVSLCPFIAVNFTTFDMLKSNIYGTEKPGVIGTLGLGAGAGLIAQSFCHPLDTVRRRMQMKGSPYKGTLDAIRRIATEEGLRGFYQGVVPNAVKIVPNNAIRFLVFTQLKSYFEV